MSRNRSSRDRTRRAALALLMEFKKGLTYLRSPPSSAKKPQIVKCNPPSQELHRAGADTHHVTSRICHTKHSPGVFSASPTGQSNKCHPQGGPAANRDCRGASPVTSSWNCLRRALKCKNLLNDLRFYYKMRDGVYNLGVFL